MLNLFVVTTILTGLTTVTTSQTIAQPKSCQNDGVIVGQDLYPKCQCSPGFKGHDCSLRVTSCEANPCRNGGTCSENKNGTFTCDCKALYYGILCEHRVIDDLYGSEILNQRENYIVQLRKWINETTFWKLCYRATDDGWLGSTFHRLCDLKKPTVTIIRSNSSIFGAYSAIGFGASNDYKSSSNSFLFSFVNKDNFSPFKSRIKTTTYAAYTNPSIGPTFGGVHDIHRADKANKNNNSYTNSVGHSYQAPTGYSSGTTKAREPLAVTYKFTPNEVETFYLI